LRDVPDVVRVDGVPGWSRKLVVEDRDDEAVVPREGAAELEVEVLVAALPRAAVDEDEDRAGRAGLRPVEVERVLQVTHGGGRIVCDIEGRLDRVDDIHGRDDGAATTTLRRKRRSSTMPPVRHDPRREPASLDSSR